MGSLHEVLSAIAFCMLLSAMLPHHGTLLSHSPALHCSWSSSMQPEIVHGEMMWKDHVPCGRRIVIKCQSSNANGWFVNMDDKESYNKGACCQATSLWVSRRDAYCSLDTRCRRSVSGDCIQQTSNWATWRYTNTFLYIHFYIYIYVCVYIFGCWIAACMCNSNWFLCPKSKTWILYVHIHIHIHIYIYIYLYTYFYRYLLGDIGRYFKWGNKRIIQAALALTWAPPRCLDLSRVDVPCRYCSIWLLLIQWPSTKTISFCHTSCNGAWMGKWKEWGIHANQYIWYEWL